MQDQPNTGAGKNHDPLRRLIKHLSKLPGIGERTASRLAFHILRGSDSYANQLAQSITDVKRRLKECSSCCQLTSIDPCPICSDPKREEAILMVVSQPQELIAIERAGGFRGRYHVLHGLLSPLDGIGPDQLRISALIERLNHQSVTEIILALSPNVEGDATSLYLSRLLKPSGLRMTRIASGVPIGGELEYADSVTLSRAIETRREL